MTKSDFLIEKDKLIKELQLKVTEFTTYALQANGISSGEYKRLVLKPQSMRMETLYGIQEKLNKIPKRVIT